MTNDGRNELSPVGQTALDHARSPHAHEAEKHRDTDVGALVSAARAGDRRALDQLLSQARPRAMAVALKVLRNPNDAEDAVQDAFLKVWRNLPRFEGRSSFFTWIHRIVMNACLDLLRREKLRTSEHDESSERDDDMPRARVEPSHDQTPERALASVETSRLVRSAIDALSPVHREALVLRELEDHSYDEIASVVRCPVGTVMSRLHHARRKVADELQLTFGSPVELELHAA